MVKFCIGMNNSLIENTRIDSSLSGSTGVFVLFHNKKIVIANVGDSRAVFLINKSGHLVAKQITVDHTPSVPTEKKRILAQGGSVKPFRCNLSFFNFPY